MKLAILSLLLTSTALGQQGWTPTNFFSYQPAWFAHQMGHYYKTLDQATLCVAPGTLESALAISAELSWDDPQESGGQLSALFVAIPNGEPQICKSFRFPPVAAGTFPRGVRYVVTPLGPVGTAFVQEGSR